MSSDIIEQDYSEVSKADRKLKFYFQELIPWFNNFDGEKILETRTEESTKAFLDRFYLFPVIEIGIENTCDDIPKFINERYKVILSAAYAAGISVASIISSQRGAIAIYIGFMKEENKANDPELFDSIVNGVMSGKKIKLKETVSISSLAKDFEYGGIVTGVPIFKKDDEKKQFNIASVVRSLYGKDYLLAIISKPISEEYNKIYLNELYRINDDLHELANITIGRERGTGNSIANNTQISEGSSVTGTKTASVSSSRTKGINIPFMNRSKNLSGTFSYAISEGTTKETTKGTTDTISEQESRSVSVERQNRLAKDLEDISDQMIERVISGFNIGFWETAITFASKDKITCDILGGSFIGELSKFSNNLATPPRLNIGEIKREQVIFLPKINSGNNDFPKKLASYLTSEELSLISSPPKESLPGYEITKMPELALTDFNKGNEIGIEIGNISDHGNPMPCYFFNLSKKDLNKHLFVCGLTGSGKTTTVKNILKKLYKNENIPFLVLELAKRDYRQLMADDVFKDKLKVFTIGDPTISPIRFNPFYIQKGIHPSVHIDYLKSIFNVSFSLYGPMPQIVEKCLYTIYIKKGWNLTAGSHPNFVNENNEYDENRYDSPEHKYCFPTLADLKDEVNNYIKNELEYEGELRDNIRTAITVRLEGLSVGAKGLMFNTYDFYPIVNLLSDNIILEMENIADDDDKAFFAGLLLVLISEYRQKDNPAINPGRKEKGLQHFMVIEEAHRLLKNVNTERFSEMVGNPKGKAVEVFCNVISEMRSLGQGIAVVEQIPTKISPDVIKNSNTKIVHRLVTKEDQSFLAGSLSISDEDSIYLNRLDTGCALCYKEGMAKPVECMVSDDIRSYAISDKKIKEINEKNSNHNLNLLHFHETYELSRILGKKGKELAIKFFNSLLTVDFVNLKELIESALLEFKKLLMFKDVRNSYDDKIMIDFFVKNIFELLNRGVYCKTFKFSNNLKKNIEELLNKPTEDFYIKVLDGFKELWYTTNLKGYIVEVVSNLSIKYLFEHKIRPFKYDDIKVVVSSYFLFKEPNANVIKDTTKIIEKKLGVNND